MSKFPGYQIEKVAITKPLMEKRRRERMNKALNEMKNILLETMGREITCHSKLEKADILENAVDYLKLLRDVYGILPGAPLAQCIRERQQGHLHSITPRLIPVMRPVPLPTQLPLIRPHSNIPPLSSSHVTIRSAKENRICESSDSSESSSCEPFRPWLLNK